jgi:small subunit ribosomal protein S1
VAEEAEAVKKLASEKKDTPGTTSLGALLKAKLDVANTQQ